MTSWVALITTALKHTCMTHNGGGGALQEKHGKTNGTNGSIAQSNIKAMIEMIIKSNSPPALQT